MEHVPRHAFARWDLRRLNKETVEGEDPIDDDADMEAGQRRLTAKNMVRKMCSFPAVFNCDFKSFGNTMFGPTPRPARVLMPVEKIFRNSLRSSQKSHYRFGTIPEMGGFHPFPSGI